MLTIARRFILSTFVATFTGLSAHSDGPKDADAEKAIQQAFDDALKAAAEIPDLFERGMAIAEIAQGQARTGAKAAAARTFQSAAATARKLPAENAKDAKDRVVLLLIIAQRHMAAYDWAGARNLMEDIIANEPLRKFGGIPKYELDSFAVSLVRWQVRAGEFDEAWKTAQVNDMASHRDAVREGRALALAQEKNWKSALATAEQIADVGGRANLSLEIAVLLHQAGQKEQARQIMEKARADTATMEASSANSVRAKLARAYAQTGNRAAALETAALIANETKSYPFREMTLTSLHLDLGEVTEALTNARLAQNAFRVPLFVSLREIAQAQSKLRKFKEAHETAEEIKHDYIRTQALLDIGKEQSRAGLKDGAVKTFRLAMQTADNYPVPQLVKYSFAGDEAKIFSEVAAAQAEFGEAGTARVWIGRQFAPKNQAYGFAGLAEGLHKRIQAAKAK